jgi:NAD+ synthase (glutamine-hydrolysing)
MNTELGYARVAVATPEVTVGDVARNVAGMVALARQAAARGADVAVFPELCLTGYTCADLFQQDRLLAAAAQGLARFLRATRANPCVLIVGAPLAVDGPLYNAAVVCQRGRLLGVVPKSYPPNGREFYEGRWFVPGLGVRGRSVALCGQAGVPFGVDLLFRAGPGAALVFGVELCEDLWVPAPPSGFLALAGATLLCNLSASNELVGKADYRAALVRQQSARCLAAYAYASAGPGESSTDLVFGGHALVAENGALLAESARFVREPQLTLADIDLAFLLHERRQNPAFGQAAAGRADRLLGGAKKAARRGPGALATALAQPFREVLFAVRATPPPAPLLRPLDAHPFVPADAAARDARCAEIFAIQSTGLATRLLHCGAKTAVIGLSGGLDSTLALLVCAEAFQRAGLAREGIRALTMPGFGTSARTLRNVRALARGLGLRLETIDIRRSCQQHLADLGHDGRTGDVTFENAQARERTQLLMDKANQLGGLVVGTGDLSELALGWCTYNGDHMSMYGVNAGVPKTLVRHLIGWVAGHRAEPAIARVLRDILATPISPELLPPDGRGRIAQKTEDVLGPYEVHDFFLYEIVRRGSAPDKVLWLAERAFAGRWPRARLRDWLRLFIRRFFAHQFKRSCLPDGPKVGSICLSPRGDWRMPSDASAAEWLGRDADA